MLGIMGLAVSWVIGEVITSGNLNAEVGLPLMLSCNITTDSSESIDQVRWLDKHSKTLLSYKQRVPIDIVHQDPNVQLTQSLYGTSSITIKRVQVDHEGCYRCFFDIWPTGIKEGETCITVTGKLRLDSNKTALNGQPTSLSCGYNLPERVVRVEWRKTAEQGDTTKVAYVTQSNQKIEEAFETRVSLSGTLGDNKLSIHQVQMEDEACYTCVLSAYPDGVKSGTICLYVYVLPQPEVTYVTSSSGAVEANCTARSRPAADITWNVAGDNRTLGPPVSSSYDHGDGTTVVTSTLTFQSGVFSDGSVQCIVRHQGLEKPLLLSLNTNVGPDMVVIVSVSTVAAVLLLCLCVCFCKYYICTGD